MPPVPLLNRMTGRDPAEAHRAATPLELLYDLCFVVAVAQAVVGLHHQLAEGHFSDGILRFALVFIAIWWAWVNFTWFSSAFDPDDAVYRLLVLVQLGGNLLMAAGIPDAINTGDFTIPTIGYTISRMGLVAQWLRAARSDPLVAPAAWRYAIGVTVMQVLWLARLALPDDVALAAFFVFQTAEMSVPVWAEHYAITPWHPTHIAERYGLFTILVLGEVVLGATVSFQAAIDLGDVTNELVAIGLGGLILLFALWWLYFDEPIHHTLARYREEGHNPFGFGYGHYFIFASLAAIGAGLEIAIDMATHHAHITGRQASACLAVPVVIYLVSDLVLKNWCGANSTPRIASYAVAIVLVLATIPLDNPVLPIGLIVAGLVAANTVLAGQHAEQASSAHAGHS